MEVNWVFDDLNYLIILKSYVFRERLAKMKMIKGGDTHERTVCAYEECK